MTCARGRESSPRTPAACPPLLQHAVCQDVSRLQVQTLHKGDRHADNDFDCALRVVLARAATGRPLHPCVHSRPPRCLAARQDFRACSAGHPTGLEALRSCLAWPTACILSTLDIQCTCHGSSIQSCCTERHATARYDAHARSAPCHCQR